MTRATPCVTRAAQRAGVNLALVTGTGAGGRITLADVRAHTLPPAPRPTSPTAGAPRPKVRYRKEPTGQIHATPDALMERRNLTLSGHRDVDLTRLIGTGQGGVITRDDVRAAAGIETPDPATIPAFTASGMDPARLRQLPGPVRAAVADEPDAAVANQLAYHYQGMSDAAAADALRGDTRVPLRLGGCKGNWPGSDALDASQVTPRLGSAGYDGTTV